MMALPELQSSYPSVGGLLFVVVAVGAILLAREPNGLAVLVFRVGRWAERRIAPTIRANLPSLPGAVGPAPGELPDDGFDPNRSHDSEGVPAHAH
jgi:hypothetical protein